MLDVRRLSRPQVVGALPELAQLRIDVFRDFPYLYVGDAEYEEAYLAPYADSDDAVIIGAYDGQSLVGAATGMPLLMHDDNFAAAFAEKDYDLSQVFYCAESVLRPAYRGRGVGHAFFDHREAAAREMGCTFSTFCAVLRAEDHPARPAGYRSLEPFWLTRGYRLLPGIEAKFEWKDEGDQVQTAKRMQFWGRPI